MKLKELIKDYLKITEETFGAEIGVHKNTVTNWCSGKTISSNGLKKIIKYCKEKVPNGYLVEFLLDRFNIPMEDIGNSYETNKKVERLSNENKELNQKITSLKEKISLLEELNILFGQEVKGGELKQWSPSETSRQILKEKEFRPIFENVPELNNEEDFNRWTNEICKAVSKEIGKNIIKQHAETIEKEKRIIELRLKEIKV